MSGQRRRLPSSSDRPNHRKGEQPSRVSQAAEPPNVSQPRPDAPASAPVTREADTTHREDQRSSFRCPVQPEQQVAVLAAKRKRHAVRLLNRSAGGFCVAYTGPAQFKSGQVLQLLSASGEHRVRVVYALRHKEAVHIGLMDLGAVHVQSSRLSSCALLVIVATAVALATHVLLGLV